MRLGWDAPGQAEYHFPHMGGFRRAGLQDRQTARVRAPTNNADGHRARSPTVHFRFAWFVEIYRACANESGPIIINHIKMGLTFDLENGAHRKDRPVGRRAAEMTMLQVGASCRTQTILEVGRLRVGVGGCTDAGNDRARDYDGR